MIDKPEVMQKVTLDDIAKEAGVSRASVSMILGGKESSFSSNTVTLVKQIAMSRNYKGLRKQNTNYNSSMNKIMLIVSANMYNPYYTQTIQAIERSARGSGYQTLSYNTYRSTSRETELLSMAVNCGMAGIIFTYIPIVNGELIESTDKSVPIIVMGDPDWTVDIDMVNVNYYSAGIVMASHLIELGHRHVAFLSTTMQEGNLQKRKRLQGIQDTFKRLGCNSSVLVRSMDVHSDEEFDQSKIEIEVGKKLVKECLNDNKITAFIGANDMVAYGIMEKLLECGYRIPEDYSVCGYDNVFPSSFRGVSLTTIDLGIEKKGELAFSMLCSKVEQRRSEKRSNDTVYRVEYKVKLIPRHSSGTVRKN